MTSTYDEDSPLAKLCEVCSYLVDRLDDVVQEVEKGAERSDRSIYPHSLGHRALFSNAKNGCGICMHLVEDLDQEGLEEMSTRYETGEVDCKFHLTWDIGTNSSDSNLSVTETVVAVLFWIGVDDVGAVKGVWRRAESKFCISFSLLEHETFLYSPTNHSNSTSIKASDLHREHSGSIVCR
jgi:hypothetical protein